MTLSHPNIYTMFKDEKAERKFLITYFKFIFYLTTLTNFYNSYHITGTQIFYLQTVKMSVINLAFMIATMAVSTLSFTSLQLERKIAIERIAMMMMMIVANQLMTNGFLIFSSKVS